MAESAESPVLQRVRGLLEEHGVRYELSSHRPVYTSADAAAVRGASLHSGAKALVVKFDKVFGLLVLPGDFKLDSKAVKGLTGVKRLRFASREEVAEITGLEPGAIPPFGSVFGLPTTCDEGLGDCEMINFNAGAHDRSIRMRYADYLVVEKPALGHLAKPEG